MHEERETNVLKYNKRTIIELHSLIILEDLKIYTFAYLEVQNNYIFATPLKFQGRQVLSFLQQQCNCL